MLREVVKIVESDYRNVEKYIPKKIWKKYLKESEQAELWVDAMKYPYNSGWMGNYGESDGELEFNVKAYLDYDEERVEELLGDSYDNLDFYIEDYYNFEREDLEEGLRSKFGCGNFSYAGRSGGYLLIGDYESAIYSGTGVNDVSIWYNDNYGDNIEEVMEWLSDLERLISDLNDEGPKGELWDDYLSDFETLLDEGPEYANYSIKKNALKVIEKNYSKLEKFISSSVDGFEKGFEDWLEGLMEANG